MKQSLKNFGAGALVALALILGYLGYAKYTALNLAAQQAGVVYQFLAEPIAKNDKGEAITRADALAAVAKRVTDAPTIAPPAGGSEQQQVPRTP